MTSLIIKRPAPIVPPSGGESAQSRPVPAGILAAAKQLEQPPVRDDFWKAFGRDLVKALVASPDALAALEMPVGLEERFAKVRAELTPPAAPVQPKKATPEPQPAVVEEEIEEPEQPKAAPAVQMVRRVQPHRTPAAKPFMAAPDAKVVSEAVLLDGAMVHEEEADDEERLPGGLYRSDDEADDVDPSLRDQGDVAIALQGEFDEDFEDDDLACDALDDEWINPNQLGLKGSCDPDGPPRGIIVPMKNFGART